jgi:2-amino-4-hydroxy-6-hydroxymethyldihydropteridine diphosphokinase
MPRVYVSIGSNIDKEKHIRAGLRELAARYSPLTLSNVYESEAIGFDGDNFYNLVAAFDTGDSVGAVTAVLHEIEQRCGRVRNGVRFGPRTLDMDILLYGEQVLHDGSHNIPHADIGNYACVLQPLAEIAPDERHPETGITYGEMWQRLAVSGKPLTRVDLP